MEEAEKHSVEEPEKVAGPTAEEPTHAVPVEPTHEEVHHAKTPLIALGIFLLILVIGGIGVALFGDRAKEVIDKIPVPSANSQSSLFSGKLTKLNQDLGLIIQTQDEKVNNITPYVTYYTAGTYVSGPYKGYTRYVAIRDMVDPSGAGMYVFASQDGKTFVLDGDPKSVSDNMDDWNNPMREMNKQKVTKVDELPTEHTPIVKLNDPFSLNRNQLLVTQVGTGTIDQWGNEVYHQVLYTDFANLPTLNSPDKNLTFYTNKQLINGLRFFDNATPSAVQKTVDQYSSGTTQTLVVDSTGLGYSYDLANNTNVAAYPALEATYKVQQQIYNNYMNQQENATASANPVKPTPSAPPYPMPPERPDLRVQKNQIKSTAQLYNSYDIAIPQACATDVNTLVAQNITDADLVEIGDSPNGKLYALKDKNHPLLRAAYDNKVDSPIGEWQTINTLPQPTFAQYIAKNPLLFLKDEWGRWDVIGEYDYKIGEGCGKPVIYLYPPKPTEVSVQFTTAMDLGVSIPTYADGWKVLAQPNGTLTDLQPGVTNCSTIDMTRHGSEYAPAACQNNQYPYLYWAGRSLERPYPVIDKGWIVARGELTQFMNSKLDEVGFTATEKNDMLSYWLSEMLGKNTPYYRISFLQTNDMNTIAPMRITPQPKSTYRLFLDYLPLTSRPKSDVLPQTLSHVVRDGFTVVEWGGLKR